MNPPGILRRLVLLSAGLLLLAPLGANAAVGSAGIQAEDMAMGNPKAPVTVVEYASAACPHCARFNNNVFPAFKKKYVDTGKVHYVYREYLTDPVPVAAAGALLARCAGKAKYFSVLDDFFHGQAQAYETGDLRGLILSVGKNAGMTQAQVEACLEDEAASKALNERVRLYSMEGVDSTPTFVVNGKKLADLDHEVQLADLDAAIAPLLKHGRR